ncbi:type II secretory pathway protein [Burkholderia cepacia]|uniref:Type II secretory pathway protein n=1 Tax=Burkholderia cepacia TaxID=292 RepID=A0A2S8HZN5_BURCE|nr:type II secretory pathway protein [Burkholderia cepacia]PQP07993.1 type II secretory pathway protein [Burkholderia cepacia]HDR9511955.1 type II secretory pathway protein [Burkholderia cepacia]
MRRMVWLLPFLSSWVTAAPVSPPPLPTLPGLAAPLPDGATPVSPGASVAAIGPLRIGNAKRIDLRFVNVAQVIDLIYAEMLQTQYVIAPDVLADQRVVSFRFDRAKGDIRDAMTAFLDSLNFGVETRDGVDYVFKRSDTSDDENQPARDVYVYAPKYRGADYLARLIQPLFVGQFTTNRAVSTQVADRARSDVPAHSAAALVDQSSDTMVFLGTSKEISLLKKVLPQVDVALGEVTVRAWVYEVSTDTSKSTGFQLAASILGGRLGLSLGSGTVDPNASALRIKAGALDAAIAALDGDSRFHVVTSPNLRIASGKHGRLNVGQSVPVVGSVSYPGASGQAVQSVQYEDAGVIFDVLPTVKGDVTEADITLEISDFQRTSTGVNNSPTKNTRKFETSMTLQDGEVIVTGGLSSAKDSFTRSGLTFLPSFMDGRSLTHSRTDIVLVLQITTADSGSKQMASDEQLRSAPMSRLGGADRVAARP